MCILVSSLQSSPMTQPGYASGAYFRGKLQGFVLREIYSSQRLRGWFIYSCPSDMNIHCCKDVGAPLKSSLRYAFTQLLFLVALRVFGIAHTTANTLLTGKQVVLHTCKNIEDGQQQQPLEESSYVYIAAYIPDEEYMSMHRLQSLPSSLFECSVCRHKHRHFEYEDAIQHLQQARQHQYGDGKWNNRSQLGHWVTSVADEVLERSNERLLRLLYALNDRTGRLLTRSVDLRNSIVNPNHERDAKYFLTYAMVQAAQNTFQFIYYSAYSVHTLHKTGIALVWPKLLASLLEHQGDSTGAEHAATNADGLCRRSAMNCFWSPKLGVLTTLSSVWEVPQKQQF